MAVSSKIFAFDREYEMKTYGEKSTLYRLWQQTGKFFEYPLLDEIKLRNIKGKYLDIGANVGNHSVYFASQCPCEMPYCVEPDENFRTLFIENTKKNVPEFNYKLFDFALLNRTGSAQLIYGEEHGPENNRAFWFDQGKINVTTIDDLFLEEKDISLVKIDVEGMEPDVVMGGDKFFTLNHPVLIVELILQKEFDTFQKIVKKYGYKCDGINYCPGMAPPTYIWE